MRGLEVTNIFQNGVALSSNNQRIQTANIERVEVVKGPSALLFGSGRPGGIINVITKKPQEETRRTLTASFDEFGQQDLLLDSTGPLNEDGSLLYRIVGSIEDSETFRKADKHTDISGKLIAPSVTWNINENNSLTASFEFISSELPRDEGTLVAQNANGDLEIADTPRSRYFGENSDTNDALQRTFSLDYIHSFANDWELETNFNYQSNNVDTFRNTPAFGIESLTPGIPVTTAALLGAAGIRTSFVPISGLLVRGQQGFAVENDRYFAALRLSGIAELGSTEHQISSGLDFNRRKFDSVTSTAYANPLELGFGVIPGLPALPSNVLITHFNALNIFDPVYGQPKGTLTPTSRTEIIDTQIGLYAQDLITLTEQWKALLGLRVDYFKRDATNTSFLNNFTAIPALQSVAFVENTTMQNLNQNGEYELSPNAGLIFQPNEQVSLFASYSESFNPNNQSVNALTGESVNIDSQEAKQYEIGVKGAFLEDKLNINLTYFDITRSNVPAGSAPFTGVTLINGEETSTGIELDASLQFAKGASLIFTYAYIDADVSKGASKGNTPRNAPQNSASLWATYEFTDGPMTGLGFGGGANYVGKRFADNGNTFELDSYTTFDATAFYYLPVSQESQLWFQVGVKNLTDEKVYIPNNNTLGIGIGAPRTLYASVGFEF